MVFGNVLLRGGLETVGSGEDASQAIGAVVYGSGYRVLKLVGVAQFQAQRDHVFLALRSIGDDHPLLRGAGPQVQ